jgi:hypothetical protein
MNWLTFWIVMAGGVGSLLYFIFLLWLVYKQDQYDGAGGVVFVIGFIIYSVIVTATVAGMVL